MIFVCDLAIPPETCASYHANADGGPRGYLVLIDHKGTLTLSASWMEPTRQQQQATPITCKWSSGQRVLQMK